MNQKQIIEKLEETLLRRYGCHSDTASPQQIYRCLCYLVNEMLVEKNTQFNRKANKDQGQQGSGQAGILHVHGVLGWHLSAE